MRAIDIRTLRMRKGLTQKRLAELLKVDQSAVALWESGATSPNLSRLKKLAEILDCTVEDLVEDILAKKQSKKTD